MNYTYVDYFKYKYKNKVKKIYIKSFPRNERFPFGILKYCSKGKNVLFNIVLDKEEMVGLAYLVDCKDFVYLMYLAVDESKRGCGYGSKILKDLTSKYGNVILSIERPQNNVNDEKLRRKNFYLKNGFYETNKFILDNKVEYEILCTNSDYEITEENLKQRYTKMGNNKFINYVISKIFNTYNHMVFGFYVEPSQFWEVLLLLLLLCYKVY